MKEKYQNEKREEFFNDLRIVLWSVVSFAVVHSIIEKLCLFLGII